MYYPIVRATAHRLSSGPICDRFTAGRACRHVGNVRPSVYLSASSALARNASNMPALRRWIASHLYESYYRAPAELRLHIWRACVGHTCRGWCDGYISTVSIVLSNLCIITLMNHPALYMYIFKHRNALTHTAYMWAERRPPL